MKILHFSDIHFWRIQAGPDPYYPKRFLGLINLIFSRRNHFPQSLADKVAKAIFEEEADVVLFSGDLTTSSLESEFIKAADEFVPLYEKWGDRLIVIPGNHDRYTPKSVEAKFYEKHFPRAFAGLGSRVFSKRLSDEICVIGFDASRPYMLRSNGDFTPELKDELDAEFDRSNKLYKHIILMGHFPYSYPSDVPSKFHHKLLGEESLAELISRHKPIAYLHGHKHVRWNLRDPITPETLCINAGPAGMSSGSPQKHAGWVLFDVTEGGDINQLTEVHLSEDGEPVRETVDIK